ncbi:MAG: hypothetical protein HQK77_16665 [Desulfobacterales bacterium]|nr:hypothetical protein [Desulfobacterales bacterium]
MKLKISQIQYLVLLLLNISCFLLLATQSLLFALDLPFERGETWVVCQGYNTTGEYTGGYHQDSCAFDLVYVPPGTDDPFFFCGDNACAPASTELARKYTIGKAILSPGNGTVKKFSYTKDEIITIELDDNFGTIAIGHGIEWKVKEPDRVKAGQLLGYVSGRPDYPHIHIAYVPDTKPIGSLFCRDTNDSFPALDTNGLETTCSECQKNQYTRTLLTRKFFLPELFISPPSDAGVCDFSVYGYANQPLYGLFNNLMFSSSFFLTGILAKKGVDRNNPIDISLDNGKWLAKSWVQNIDFELVDFEDVNNIYTFGLTGNFIYQPGDYLFIGFIAESKNQYTKGYPIIFSILADSRSLIVDNNQYTKKTDFENQSNFSDYDNDRSFCSSNSNCETEIDPCFSTSAQLSNSYEIPGYYTTARLVKGGSNISSQWWPKKAGNYHIEVFIPEGIDSSGVYYVVRKNSNDAGSYVKTQTNQSINMARWVALGDFELSESGYVALYSGAHNPPLPTDAQNNNSNFSISIDAVKFEAQPVINSCAFANNQWTILGSNFGSAQGKVYFSLSPTYSLQATPLTVKGWADTSIQVSPPANCPGPGFIIVTTASGLSTSYSVTCSSFINTPSLWVSIGTNKKPEIKWSEVQSSAIKYYDVVRKVISNNREDTTGYTSIFNTSQIWNSITSIIDSVTGYILDTISDWFGDIFYRNKADHSMTYFDKLVEAGKSYSYGVKACSETGCSDYVYSTVDVPLPTLTPPTGVTATTNDPSKITIKWNSVNGADNYQVFRGTSSTTIPSTAAFTTRNTYIDDDDTSVVKAGTTYYYWVKACSGSTCSATSSPAATGIRPLPTPTAPTGVTATTNDTAKIRISWNSVDGVNSYKIFCGTSSSSPPTSPKFTVTGAPPVTYKDDTTASTGTTYYYWVSACRGTTCSGLSSYASGSRPAPIPLAPTTVTATDQKFSDKITITWSAVTGATSYEVYRGPSESIINEKIITINSPTVTYDDRQVALGQTYYYKVKACNNSGCSYLSTKTGKGSLLIPACVVSNFMLNGGAADTTITSVLLNHTATNNPTHYMASESRTFSGSSWISYVTSPSLLLSTTPGTKTVYFKVKNSAGKESAAVSDSIVLIVRPTISSFKINNVVNGTTTSRAVKLNNTTSNTASNTQPEYIASESSSFSGASWAAYSTAPSFNLTSSGNGIKTVYFKVRNKAGESSVSSATITLNEPIKPSVTLNINNGASSTPSRTVTLNNSVTNGATHYMASESSSFSGATWSTYSSAPSFKITSTVNQRNVTKTIYFKVKNAAGESDKTSDTITLNLTPTYKVDTSSTTAGNTTLGSGSELKMTASISGTTLKLTITKKDGTAFKSSGTLTINVGGTTGPSRGSGTVTSGMKAMTYNGELLDYAGTYNPPKKFYAVFKPNSGGETWVGPISVSEMWP